MFGTLISFVCLLWFLGSSTSMTRKESGAFVYTFSSPAYITKFLSVTGTVELPPLPSTNEPTKPPSVFSFAKHFYQSLKAPAS